MREPIPARDDRRPQGVIMLGLDAMDVGLIEGWAAQGHLPTFAGLLRGAAWGRLSTSSAVLQASVWPTIATGCSPGKHGIYYMMQMRPGKREVVRIRAEHCLREPFWAYLEAGDGPACIVDVPLCPPVCRINGLQVVEWGSFDHFWGYATCPVDRMGHIVQEYGRHPLRRKIRPPAAARQCRRLRDRLVQGVQMKHRLNIGLLERGPYRLFFSVFGEAHAGGHYLWSLHDSSHPRHDPAMAPGLASALRDVYAAIDRAVGEVLDRYAGRYAVLVFAGHGMGPGYCPHHLLPELLVRMGLTVRPDGPPRNGLARSVLRAAGCLVPPQVRDLVTRSGVVPASVRDRAMAHSALSGVDFARSRAFCLPTDLQGYVRINLKGREPDGLVEPGREYDELCNELEGELLELRDADSGEPVVSGVVRTHLQYAGSDHLERLPDLCILWQGDRPVTRLRSPRYGIIEGRARDLGRSGNHRPQGFIIAAGEGMPAGPRALSGDVLDLAPTAFRLLGREPLADWDGRPISELSR